MKKKMAAWIVLTIITFVAGVCLALTNEVTADKIAQQQIVQNEQTRKNLLSEAAVFEEYPADEKTKKLDYLYIGKNDAGETVGYVAKITTNGFGGEVEVIVGMTNEQTLTGISVGGANFSETAGLGAKSKEAKFTDQFKGKSYQIKVVKAGEEKNEQTIDAITAATITSRAVTAAVNNCLKALGDVLAPEVTEEDVKPQGLRTASGTGAGLFGDITANVTIDADGAITAVSFVEEGFPETDGIGTQIFDASYTGKFVGMTDAAAMEAVDVISGATYSSKGAAAAVSAAYKAALEMEIPAATADAERTATGAGAGLFGDITANVTVDAQNKITAVSFVEEGFPETDGIGTQIFDASFTGKFVGLDNNAAIEAVDVIASATYSSKGAISAVSAAYTAAVAMEVPTASASVTGTGKGAGLFGDITANVTLDAQNKITAVSFVEEGFPETDGIGTQIFEAAYTDQFVGLADTAAIEAVDVISGATYSSKGAVLAVSAAYTDAASKNVAPAAGKEGKGTGKGLMGDITATVTVDANGAVTKVVFDEDNFSETDGIGTQIFEASFTDKFVGLADTAAIEAVDSISGATYSSKGAIAAVSAAYADAMAK